MRKHQFIKWETRMDRIVTLDKSDRICQQYGFKAGDRIREPLKGRKATIMGVGPNLEGLFVLWFLIDGEEKISYYYQGEQNLRKAGAKPIEQE